MKHATPAILLGAALLAATPLRGADERREYREFTGANGRVIKAVLVDKDDDSATLLLATGARATVPLEKLSEQDRSLLESAKASALQAQQSAAAAAQSATGAQQSAAQAQQNAALAQQNAAVTALPPNDTEYSRATSFSSPAGMWSARNVTSI